MQEEASGSGRPYISVEPALFSPRAPRNFVVARRTVATLEEEINGVGGWGGGESGGRKERGELVTREDGGLC